MKREIRFRAWDGEQKRMYSWDELCGRANTVPEAHSITSLYSHGDGSWEIMQFTGLLDKNGKEIYESDIIDNPFKGQVQWCDAHGGWVVKSLITDHRYNLTELRAAESEIIGNIYTTPSLLNPKEKEKCK